MKDSPSLPLYYWMIEQFKGKLGEPRNWSSLAQRAREVFLAQALALLRMSGQRAPPFDPFATLGFRNIHTVTWVSVGEEGRLIPDAEGFQLILRKPEKDAEEPEKHIRVRTTVAHELGHTFFYDMRTLPPKPGLQKFRFSDIPNRIIREKEEWWCFDFARHMLLPRFSVEHFLQGSDVRPSLNLALRIKHGFKVSWDLLLRRLIHDLKMWRFCALLRLEFDDSEVTLRNGATDVWKGANARISNPDVWVQENNHFLSDCLRKKQNSAAKSWVTRFSNPRRNYVLEIVSISRSKPFRFICLIKEIEGSLNTYIQR